MSAPPSGSPGSSPSSQSPAPGYYPDPSIPNYIRYWNGSAWVPGTSRPAPAGTASPARTPAVDESGPMFLDADPTAPEAVQGPAEPAPPAEPAAASHEGAPEPPAWPTPAQQGPNAGRPPISWGAAEAPPRAEQQQPPPAQGGYGYPQAGQAVQGAYGYPQPQQPPAQGGYGYPQAGQAAQGAYGYPQPQAGPQQAPAQGAYGYPQPQADPQQAPAQGAYGYPQPQADPQQAPAQGGYGYPHGRPAAGAREAEAVPQQGQAPWPERVQELAREGGAPDPWRPVPTDPFASARGHDHPAGLFRRVAALLIDVVLFLAVTGAAALPLGSAAYHHAKDKVDAAKLTGETVKVWLLDGTTGAEAGGILVAALIAGLLLEVLPTATWGRTLGKKLLGVRVLDIEAQLPPSFGISLRRWVLRTGLNALVVGLLGMAWALWDRPWHQTWHDKASRTFVAKS